jgi:hypothetical protein
VARNIEERDGRELADSPESMEKEELGMGKREGIWESEMRLSL